MGSAYILSEIITPICLWLLASLDGFVINSVQLLCVHVVQQ